MQILRALAYILVSTIVVIKGNISGEVTCTKTKAYRNVKHNFVIIVGEKVKGWKVVDVKIMKDVVCGLALRGCV